MKITLVKNYVGANRYCDSPASLLQVEHGYTPVQQEAFRQPLVAVLRNLYRQLAEDAYAAPRLQGLDSEPALGLAGCHLWLHCLMAGLVDRQPPLARVLEQGDQRYRVLIGRSITEGIAYETLSFSGAALGYLADATMRGVVAELPVADFLEKLVRLESAKRGRCPDQSSQALIDAAMARDIPVLQFEAGSNCYQLGMGYKRVQIMETNSSFSSVVTRTLTHNKWQGQQMMMAYGIPCAKSKLVGDAEQAVKAAIDIGYPVVVKPQNGMKGIGITVGVNSSEEAKYAFQKAVAHSRGVLVEEFIPGDDHRILILDGKVIAVALRAPAQVIGNGVDTVEALIRSENKNPLRGEGYTRLMQTINVDNETLRMLTKQGLTLDSIPQAGFTVSLQGTANISTGGHAVDKTDAIHPDNRIAAESAARLCGGNLMGVDFLSPDISRSYRELGGAICEINMCPGLRPHQIANPRQDLATPIVDSYLQDDGRIPLAAVTGTKGKTTTTNMLEHILSSAGYCTGKATTAGITIGADEIRQGDCAGARSARRLWVDPMVEAAVVEVALGGLLASGLGYDYCNVSAVTNIADDHMGENGISSIEELASLKGIVACSSRDMTVLNGDNPHCLDMVSGLNSRRLCLVSRSATLSFSHPDYPVIETCVIEDGEICLRGESGEILRIAVADVPVTVDGRVRFNIENAQFAIAMAHGMGVDPDIIRRGVTTFTTDIHSNKGR